MPATIDQELLSFPRTNLQPSNQLLRAGYPEAEIETVPQCLVLSHTFSYTLAPASHRPRFLIRLCRVARGFRDQPSLPAVTADFTVQRIRELAPSQLANYPGRTGWHGRCTSPVPGR